MMSAPTSSAEEVRSRVLADHAILRSLSRTLVAVAREAVCDDKQKPYLRGVLAQLATELEVHLQYEEKELIPILRDADAWGPVRVDIIAEEHAEQRSLLKALLDDAEGVRTLDELTAELVAFADSFERDMADEEERLLNTDALGEEYIILGQTDG